MQPSPRTLSQPADRPPLQQVGDLAAVKRFQQEFAAQQIIRRSKRQETLKGTLRAWAGRVSGRADRRLLLSLADAMQALIVHQHNLVDRINSHEILNAELGVALGEDLVRLRAETMHLRRLTESTEVDRGG